MIAIAGFLIAAGFILYVLFGYPLLLGLLAWRMPRPVRRAAIEPSVSILVAVHNGEAFIAEKIHSILQLDYPREKMRIVIASDGSTDRTEEIIAKFDDRAVRLLRLERCGKSAALNAAMAEASGEILVFTDVRQALAPESLRLLVENFADPEVGAASGELVFRRDNSEETADAGLYWKYEVWIRLRLSALDSIFGATGAYYAIRRELAAPMPSETLLDDMHLPLRAFFRGYRLILDPRVRMYDYPTNLGTEFRRKVRTLAGNYQILRAYPQLFGPRNRMWLHFVSYKLARLMLPFALIVMAVCSCFLPGAWFLAAVTSQAAFYCAALADVWIPERWRWKRVTSPIRTFLTLMAASLLAVSVFFVPSHKLWRPTTIARIQP